MALSTTNDYKNVLYRIVNIMGPDQYSWVREAGIATADAAQIASEAKTWFLAQPDRIHETHQEVAK